jgi:hypothetical protein
LKLYESLKKLQLRSKHPFGDAAVITYELQYQQAKISLENLTSEVKALVDRGTSEHDSLLAYVVQYLVAQLKRGNPDQQRYYLDQLLRLAVYHASEEAANEFIRFASLETSSADPLFFQSINNVARLKEFDINAGSASVFKDHHNVTGILNQIVSNQNHNFETQNKLVDFVHKELVTSGLKTILGETDIAIGISTI